MSLASKTLCEPCSRCGHEAKGRIVRGAARLICTRCGNRDSKVLKFNNKKEHP